MPNFYIHNKIASKNRFCNFCKIRDEREGAASVAVETKQAEEGQVRHSLAHRIRTSLAEFTPSERKVARGLLADYPSAGLDSVQHLAERAEVSAPSVVRFARRLGFEGFSDFQKALREELSTRSNSPLQRLAAEPAPGDTAACIAAGLGSFAANLQASFAQLPSYEVEQAVALLAAPERRLILGGGRISQTLASYCARHMQQVRPQVLLLPETRHERIPFVLDTRARDVFLLFDFRRYQKDIVDLARMVAARGATVILITDSYLSPIASCARVVLSVSTGSAWPFDSYAGAFALIELLMAMAMAQAGDPAVTRMRAWDDMDPFDGNPPETSC